MNDSSLTLALASALWLGLLTSISPCPLSANIAAVAFIGRKLQSPLRALAAGLLYACGRLLVYIVLAALLVGGALSTPKLSAFLQLNMYRLIGPILILTAIVVLELLPLPARTSPLAAQARRIAEKGGALSAFLLGALFALLFCPVSAALFFGSLLPLAIANESVFVLPALYGLGTALPVVLFAAVLAFGGHAAGRLFSRLALFEKWARLATGLLFLGLGIYYSLAYIFKVI